MDCSEKYTNQQRVLSICYGYGGLEKGVSNIIPIRTVAYVEIEAFQIFNLVSAMEANLVDKAPVWTDLKTFDAKPFHRKVHGIIGGYPCQGESVAGKRKLWNDPRFLWPYIERIIKSTRPLWCFFENVAGHLTGSFPYILKSLRSMGYQVETGLFTAFEVGAPHQRKRVFILACSNIRELGRCLANNDNKYGSISKISEWNDKTAAINGSDKMGVTNSKRRNGNGLSSRQEKKFTRTTISSEPVSHSTSKRNGESSQGYKTRKFIQNGNQWPAPPGERQYSWEANRTVEPGMGCTVNGYNFRTELLRQYGNGVVSQTATKAFSLLLDQHLKNLEKKLHS